MPAKTSAAKKATKSAGTTSSRKSSAGKKASRGKTAATKAPAKTTAATKRSTRSRTADRSRINVSEAYEVRDWSKQLGVTPARLKKLVSEHGTSAAAVRKAATSSKKRSRTPDRSRVNVHRPYELRYWTKALNVTGERLKDLVKQHGPSATGIRKALGMS